MRRLTMILAALTLLVAACGDDDDATAAPADGDDTVEVTVEEAGDDEAADDADDGGGSGGEAETVAISDFSFQPGTTEVAAGTTVSWTNEDGVPHTVTAGAPDAVGDAFDEAVDAGGAVEVAFDEAGTFAYFCAIHPTMTGQIVVS